MRSQPIAFISGALGNKPANGGNAWTRLNWLLGLKRLGFDVYFVEQINERSCIDCYGQPVPFRQSENLAYFQSVLASFDLGQSCALILEGGKEIYGRPLAELQQLAQQAEFLFNINGHLTQPELFQSFHTRIYLDDDPGFTQFWHASGHSPRLRGHSHYFTIGSNIGAPDCEIPVGDIPWRYTRCPLLLDHWPAKALVTRHASLDRFTTVASWRGAYGPVQYNGKSYGLKVHQFRKFIELPRRTRQKFEIALQIHPADHKDSNALVAHGWSLLDPRIVAGSPHSFRSYVQNSGAEFSVAQGLYVETNSGWFSDRTIAYLASGKPALVQDTGFSRHLPSGQGLVAFRNLEEAAASAESIARDYEKHCRSARAIAEEFFDSDKVIRKILEQLGTFPSFQPQA